MLLRQLKIEGQPLIRLINQVEDIDFGSKRGREKGEERA